MKRNKLKKRLLWALVTLFIFMNVVSFFHAYKFTHFAGNDPIKTQSPEKLGSLDKIKTLVLGVNNPRPVNTISPVQKFEIIILQSNKKIECWSIKADNPKGTVILFHGYSGKKSLMLDKSDEFLKMGYNTLLVDFMGSGGSEGNQTTLGFRESEEVKTAFDYLAKRGEKNIYLFGTSMGAVAILKAINDYGINPTGIIIECPFGSMYQTTCARFKIMNAPTFPIAALLVFWGGIQNNFWAFGHNPTTYAKKVNCPTLLLYGEQDKNVSREEIDTIYGNLKGMKMLRTYEHAGHENYLIRYKQQWVQNIQTFMNSAQK
jgi:uncharacterized protein